MFTSPLNPHSKKTYKGFSIILIAYVLFICASISLTFYHLTIAGWISKIIAGGYVLLHLASYAVVIVICQLLQKSTSFILWLIIQWIISLLIALTLGLFQESGQFQFVIMLNGVMGLAYIITLFTIRSRELSRFFIGIGISHIIMVAGTLLIGMLPVTLLPLIYWFSVVPIIILYLLVQQVLLLLKRNELEESLLKDFEQPAS